MNCEVCKIIEGETPERVLYKDEMAIAFFANDALADGHVVVAPLKHYEDIDKIPKDIVSHLFYVASFASTGVYEIMGGGNVGTNILLNEGNFQGNKFSHVTIDVVPRVENDAIKFKWEPKPADQTELNETMDKIQAKTFVIGKSDSTASGTISQAAGPMETLSEEDTEEGQKNYLLDKLNRLP